MEHHLTPRARLARRDGVTLHLMADGSAVVGHGATGKAYAFNAEAAAMWEARSSWTPAELRGWLLERLYDPDAATESAWTFLKRLVSAGLVVQERDR